MIQGEQPGHAFTRAGLHRQQGFRAAVAGCLFEGSSVLSGERAAERVGVAYLARGREAIGALRGSFAGVVVDLTRSRMFAARSAPGERPLFWRRESGTLALASEVKQLLAAPMSPPSVDRDALLSMAAADHARPDRTAFREVHRVRAGTTLAVVRAFVRGILEATLSCGLPLPVLAAGLAGYPMVSSAVRAAAFVAAAALLGARVPLANWPLGITAAVLGSISFVGLGLIGAAFVLLLRQAAALIGWLVTTLGLAAGVLFPPRLLPGRARWAGPLSPFTHTLRIVRGSILTGSSWSSSGDSLALLGGLALLYAVGGVLALGAALHWTKRTGGVSQY
jgi:hypothetical protein